MKKTVVVSVLTASIAACGGGGGGSKSQDDGMVATPSYPLEEGTCAAYVQEPSQFNQVDHRAFVSRIGLDMGRTTKDSIGRWERMPELFCGELDKDGNDYAEILWHWDSFKQQTIKSITLSKFLDVQEANQTLVEIGSSIHLDEDEVRHMVVENSEILNGKTGEYSPKYVYWREAPSDVSAVDRGNAKVELWRGTFDGLDGVLVRGGGSRQSSDYIRYDYAPMNNHYSKYYIDQESYELWFDQAVYSLGYKYAG